MHVIDGTEDFTGRRWPGSRCNAMVNTDIVSIILSTLVDRQGCYLFCLSASKS